MSRLFVAIGLPGPVSAALAAIQPLPAAGLRLMPPEQMHLTLHFIGEGNIRRTSAALRTVIAPALTLRIAGVGQFPPAGKPTTLWAGIEPDPNLNALHIAVGQALASIGFKPEARRYNPHITLARCKSTAPVTVIEAFHAKHAAFSLPEIPISEFSLYSSIPTQNGPLYRREQSFALQG